MILIATRPKSGRSTHIFPAKGDDRSLCLRAPLTSNDITHNLEHVTCPVCSRAYDLLKIHFSQKYAL